MKKGISLLSDLFLLFVVIAISIMITIFLYAAINVYGIGARHAHEVSLKVFYEPVDYSNAFSAFLESTHQEIPMKRILTAVAIQRKYKVYVDGKWVDVKDAIDDLLPEFIIAGDLGSSRSLQKFSTKLFLFDKTTSDLELYVGSYER